LSPLLRLAHITSSVAGRSTRSLDSTQVTNQQLLNSIGLVLGMIGVIIIFRYGPPQPTFESGVAIGLEDGTVLSDGRTVADHDREVSRVRALYSRMSKFGLILVFVGFGFQLWATFS
jgi:hypothetical protein